MKSKVTKCEFEKSWEGSHGKFDQYLVAFEDGNGGQVSVKHGNPPPWQVDEEAEFEITKNTNPQFPDRVKKVQPQGGGGKGWRPATLADDKIKWPSMHSSTATNGAVSLAAAGIIEPKDIPKWMKAIRKSLTEEALEAAKELGL